MIFTQEAEDTIEEFPAQSFKNALREIIKIRFKDTFHSVSKRDVEEIARELEEKAKRRSR